MTPGDRSDLPPLDAIDGLLAGARDLNARLERWTAEASTAEAADRRGRERWLRQQAAEQANLLGVLVDLAEQRIWVALHSVGGRHHRGVIAAVGVDFCAMRTEHGRQVLVAHQAISTVRPQGTGHLPVGDRDVQVDLRFVDAIGWLAADRPRVSVATTGNEVVAGELRGMGVDLLTVDLTSGRRERVYLPLAAIAEITRN